MNSSFFDLFRSSCFWSPFCAWLMAQFVKMVIGFRKTRRLDFSYLVSTGGMPSAHSAMASGLATAIGIKAGFGSPSFVIALAFSLIVMFDAATVRRAAGLQARVLNQMVDQFFKEHRFSEDKLKELLGHTRLEVSLGMVIGILTAMGITALGELL